MNFNNNNNVSRWSGGTCGGLIFKERYYESFEELLFVDGLALGGLLAFLGLFFFSLKRLFTDFSGLIGISGLFLDAKIRPLKYSGGIWGWMMTGRNKESKKVERPSHADERTSVSKRNVTWFGKLVCLDLPIYRFDLC